MTPKRSQVLGRQVDAAVPEVLGDVLPVLGELQRGAHAVGERDPVGRRGAEHVQHELADRVGGQVAVADQLVERLVRRLSWSRRFASISRWNGPRGRSSSCTVGARRRRSGCSGLPPARRRGRGRPRSASSAREPVAGDGVADLVDEPREAVDREQVVARPRARARARRPRSSRPGSPVDPSAPGSLSGCAGRPALGRAAFAVAAAADRERAAARTTTSTRWRTSTAGRWTASSARRHSGRHARVRGVRRRAGLLARPADAASRDGLPRRARAPELLGVGEGLRPAGPPVPVRTLSWSLPAHLYMVSGWSAQLLAERRPDELPAGGPGAGLAARAAPQNPTNEGARLRLDGSHVPAAHATT